MQQMNCTADVTGVTASTSLHQPASSTGLYQSASSTSFHQPASSKGAPVSGSHPPDIAAPASSNSTSLQLAAPASS